MSEAKLIKKVRCYSLWAVIGSAVLLAILQVLQSWGAIDFSSGDVFMGLGGDPTFWGKLQESLVAVFGFGIAIILILLFASLIRGGKKKKCCCDKCCDDKGAMKPQGKASVKK